LKSDAVCDKINDGTVTRQYSQELDTAVIAVKSNEERRLEYMTLAMHDMEIREEALEEGLEKGREEGREEGRIEGREKGKDEMAVSSLRTIMKKMKLSAEGAMDFMDIPAEDQPKYALMLREE
jgi:predicted transposase YdaD